MANNNIGVQDLENDIYMDGSNGYGQATETTLGLVKAVSVTPEHVNLVAIDEDSGLLYSIGSNEVDLTGFYTKGETYSKGEIDVLLASIESLSSDDVYLRTETYSRDEVDDLISSIEIIQDVTTVNGKTGNVELDAYDIEFNTVNTVGDELNSLVSSISDINNNLASSINVQGVVGSITDLPDSASVGDLYGVFDEFEAHIQPWVWLEYPEPKFYLMGDLAYGVDLDGFITETYLENVLNDYDTSAEVDVKLEGYVSEVELASALEGYVSEEGLSIELEGYVSEGELASAINVNNGNIVTSVNGVKGDVLLNGENIPILTSGGESIKDYIDNSSGSGNYNISYTKEHSVTSVLSEGENPAYEGAVQSFNDVSEFFTPTIDGRGVVMTQDVSELWIYFASRLTTSENIWLIVNGKTVAGLSTGTSSFVNSFRARNLKIGDIVKVGGSSSWGVKNYDTSIDKSDNYMYYTVKQDGVITAQDIVTKDEIIKPQDYAVTYSGAITGDGTWKSAPLTYIGGNGNNVYEPSYFASLNDNGDIVLSENFSSICNKVSTKGTAYLLGASNDVFMRVLLSPPNADDIANDKNNLTSGSIILGESMSVKSASQDVVNLSCRDFASLLTNGVNRDGWVLRVQFRSSSNFVVEDDPNNNNIDFVAEPL